MLEQLKDSGHSLSSEGKREHREHRERGHKSRDKTRTRSRSRAPGNEDDEERRRRKEEKREARRLAALDGELTEREGKSRKHKEGRARSGSERKEKEFQKEVEMGYPVGYGSHSQQPWHASGIEVEAAHKEDVKAGFVKRTFSRFLKF